MNINQHFSNLATKAAEDGTDTSQLLTQRDRLFTDKVIPELVKRKANDTAIVQARKKWNSQTDQVMQSAGLLPKAGQSSQSFAKDKRAEKAIQESAKTGSSIPVIKESIKSSGEMVGNFFGQGVGGMIEGAAGFVRDIGENEKNSIAAKVANYGKNVKKDYQNSASSFQKELQAGEHGKAAQLASGAVQSIPAMALPFGAAKGVAAAASKVPLLASKAPVLGMGAGLIAGHTQNYGEVRSNATANLERDFPTWEKLQGNPLYQQNFQKIIESGVNINQARKMAHAQTLDELSESAADKYGTAMTALDFIAPSGAVLGSGILKKAPASKVGKTLVGGGVSSDLVRREMTQSPRVGMAKLIPDVSVVANKAAAKMVGKQALEEGLQGGIGEYGAQSASANIGGQAVKWSDIGKSFLEEAVIGGIMGGGMQSATGGSPTSQAKEVAKQLRNQTNLLRQEEASARNELAQAMKFNDPEKIQSAQANLSNIGVAANKVKAAYNQYGIETPYFVSRFADHYKPAEVQEQPAPEVQPVPEDVPQQQEQPAPAPQQGQPTPFNSGMANTTNLVMDSVTRGLISPEEAQLIQTNPLRGDVFSLAHSGDEVTAHNIVMNAVSAGNISPDEAQYLIEDIPRYSQLAKPKKPSLSNVVNDHIKQQITPQQDGGLFSNAVDLDPNTLEPIAPSQPSPFQEDFSEPKQFMNPTRAHDYVNNNGLKDSHELITHNDGVIEVRPRQNNIPEEPNLNDFGYQPNGNMQPVSEDPNLTDFSDGPTSVASVQDIVPEVLTPQEEQPVAQLTEGKTEEESPSNDPTFAEKFRDAHLNNPSIKPRLINDEIDRGRPRPEVLKEVADVVKLVNEGMQNNNATQKKEEAGVLKSKEVTLKDGQKVRLKLTTEKHNGDGAFTITALNEKETNVGELGFFTIEEEGNRFNPQLHVDPEYRRKGLATAMYDFAEENGGKIPELTATHGALRTGQGQAFREAREARKNGLEPSQIDVKEYDGPDIEEIDRNIAEYEDDLKHITNKPDRERIQSYIDMLKDERKALEDAIEPEKDQKTDENGIQENDTPDNIKVKAPTPAKQDNDDVQQLDQTSGTALEGTPSEDVSRVREQGDSTKETPTSSGTDLQGSRSTRTRGDDTRGSVADGERELSISARRNDSNNGLDPQQAIVADNAPVDAFVIDESDIGKGGKKTKFKANIEAIKVIKQLEAENRPATKAEQKTLSKFVGFGGLAEAFKREDGSIATGWEKEVAELESILTKKELEAAVDSSIAAHYTSPEIVKALWQAVENFGFKNGRILEPSVGVGNFFGLMPKNMRKASNLYAVELDNITGAVAKNLYPEANIKAPMGFQDYQTIDNYFDIAIGNPPFSSITINDQKRPSISGFSLHNYFFAKSVDSLKPNGVLAMVVTNRFMDKMSDKERTYISERAELVGAIRLPNDAFLSNAGTQVTTDIIFLRKKAEGESSTGEAWLDVKNYKDKDGNTVPLNEYFVKHPENMLGDFGAYGSMYRGGEPALIKREKQNTQQLLSEAISKLPKDVFKAEPNQDFEQTRQAIIRDISEVKVGAKFVNSDGNIHERLPDIMGDQKSQVVEFANDRAKERVIGMIQTAERLSQLRTLQLDKNATDKQIATARKELNTEYDAFVQANGFINSDTNKRLMRDDPNWAQLSALENKYDRGISASIAKATGQTFRKPSAEKAAIFSMRTQIPVAQVESVANAQDALTESLNQHGYVNTQTMQQLYAGKSENEIISELGDLIYEDPINGYVVRDEYLSGNVKQKLAQAKEQAEKDPKYEINVRALEKVIPADIEALDIDVKIGSHWIPAHHMSDFVSFLTGSPEGVAEYSRITNKWEVTPSGITATASATYATDRVDTKSMLSHAINGTKPTVYDKFSDGTSSINQNATLEASQRVELIKSAWKEWLWENDARREHLERIYNDVFNTTVNREYDGSHLAFHGMNSGIELRPHQKNAVWRSVQSKSTLYDHTVGAGKTFTVIAAAMEMRRMGIANKPLIVVPNHLVGQWANDFVLLYPNANILAATKKDFEKANRKRFIAKMANGDYDAIIIAHSSFSKISISPEQEQVFIDQEIAEIMEFEADLRAKNNSRTRNAKAVAKRRLALEEKKKNLLNSENKDTDNIYWHELGIDSVMLDEAHEFKNLEFTTSMQNVAGLGTGKGSQKAKDLFAKIQIMQGNNPKSKLIFATGTPISNTMAEMFTMQRYLDWENLKSQGINHFDAWARVFGEVVSDWELSPSGKYKLTNRFAKFVNMPELMQGYLSFSDVMNRDDINAQLAKEGKTLGTPKLKGDKPQNIVVERSDEQADYIGMPTMDEHGFESYPEGSLVWRTENLPRKPEKGADNMLKIMGDARKAALDMRLIDPDAADYEGSKVNVATDSIFTTYKKWNAKKGTQLVFCDLSTPKGAVAAEKARIEQLVRLADDGDESAQAELDKLSPDELSALDSEFSVYDDLKAKLIAKGIKESEIAFIHDAKTELQKQELFEKVKRGDIRVLMGSTAKMGAGMNVQNKLVALHHLDAPWRPSDLEQREGRIIRQGNDFYKADPNGFEIEISRYATKQTLDSRMWQTIESKAKFIEQVRKGAGTTRVVEDIAGEAANAAEMKAASSGDPRILEEMDLRKQIRELEDDKRNFDRGIHRTKGIIKSTENDIASYSNIINSLKKDMEIKQPEQFVYVEGKTKIHQEDKGARDDIAKIIEKGIKNALAKGREEYLGQLNGFKISASPSSYVGNADIYILGNADPIKIGRFEIGNSSSVGLVQKILNQIKSLPEELRAYQKSTKSSQEQIPVLRAKIENAEWGKSTDLNALKTQHNALIDELKPKKKEAEDNQNPERKNSRRDGDKSGSTPSQVRTELVNRFGEDIVSQLEEKDILSIIPTYTEQGVEGFAEGGKVTLVADSITAENIVPVFLHELGGHVGMQGVLKASTYDNLMADFDRLVEAGNPEALEAKRLAERESGATVQKDEYLPYLITIASQNQTKNGAAQRFVKRIISAIKAWAVHRLGLNLKLNPSDIVALAERMVNQVAQNDKPTGKEINRDSGINRPFYNDDVVGLWSVLAQDDDAFQLPTSDKTDLADIFDDLEGGLLTPIESAASSAKYAGAERMWRVKMPVKGTAVIYQLKESVWVDVSMLKQGGDGKRIYNAVANYAHNNDLVFTGDPAGLSDVAMIRRLENMISSALKFGTTKHLYPHEKQSEGDSLVPAVKWKMGDDAHNLKQMIMASYEATKRLYPEIESISYNPEKDVFDGVASGRLKNKENSGQHREFTGSNIQELADVSRRMQDERGSGFTPSAGRTSIERAILTHTFLQETSREARSKILDRLGNVGSQRLTENNAVLYSKKDSGRRYSRTSTNPQNSSRSKQRELLDKAASSAFGQMSLRSAEGAKTLSNRTLNLFQTMLHKALKDESGEFKKTFDLVQGKINHVTFASTRSMDVAPNVLTQLETGGDYWKEVKRVGRTLGNGLSGGKVEKAKIDKDLAKVGNLLFENTLLDNSERHTDKELRQLGFDQDQIGLYNEVREAIDTSLDTFANTTFSNIYKHLGGTNEEVLELEGQNLEIHAHYNEVLRRINALTNGKPEKVAARQAAIEAIDKVFKKANDLKDQGYVPLMRFGKYFIRIYNPTTGEVAYRQHFESESERNMFYRNYDQSKLPVGYEIEQGQINELQHKLFQGVSPETVALFAKESGLPIGDAEKAYIKFAVQNNHALKRLLKRQGIDGFDTDVKRVLASFVMSNARYSANQTYNPAIDDSITNIKDPAYQEDAIRLRDYSLDTQEELAPLKNFAFVYYMGFSAMFGLVNLTQPLLQTFPYLMQYSKDHGTILKAFGKAVTTWRKGTDAMDGKYKAHYERARKEGHLDPQNTWMMQGLERGKSGLGASTWQLISHASGLFAQASETVNRRTTLFAALDVAESMGQAKLEKLGFKDAYDFAVRAIQETQGIYNKGNRPRVSRGNIGSVLMMYKQFMIAYLEQMSRMQKSGLYGGEDDEFKKNMAKLFGFGISKSVLVMLGILMSFSGATGLPFVRDILDGIETAGGLVGKPVNTEREVQIALHDALGQTLGGAVNTALMDGFVNLNPLIDVKGRMGMGDLIPASAYFSPTTSEYMKSSELSNLAGPMGGLLEKLKESIALAQVGAYGQSGVQLLPKAITSMGQGAIAATTGDYRNMKTGVKTNDATVLDGIVKALDAQPAGIAKEGRIRGLEMKDKAAKTAVNSRWKERYEEALDSKDRVGILAIQREVKEHNKQNPRYPVTFNQKTTETNYNKSNQKWQDKRKDAKGLEWMDQYNPYLNE